METKPLVTFIIPVYNLPVTMLSQCIESIRGLSLGQSEREIIVVDDGSPVLSPLAPHLSPLKTACLGLTKSST